jgi:phage-related minor tail protein
MTLRIALQIDGDARGAQRAADDTRKSLALLGQETGKLAAPLRDATGRYVALGREAAAIKPSLGNPFGPIEQGAGRATASVGSMRMMFRMLSREAALVGGPLAGIIGQVGTLTVGAGRLGVAITVGTLTIAAIAAAAYKAVTAFSELEQHQVKVAIALGMTRTASGQTIGTLEGLTRELSKSGTQTVSDIREAEVALLRFKAVGGDTFGSVLRVSRDIAASGFAPMKDAAIALAKAISDPTKELDGLKEIGVSLSAAQRRLAIDFFNTGQTAKVAQIILNAASQQFAGADAKAADTLSAAWGRVAKSSGTWFEQIGGEISEATRLKTVLDAVASALERVATGRRRSGTIGLGIALPKADRLPRPDFASRFDQMTSDLDVASGPMAAAQRALQERIKGVVDALLEEARAAGLNATQQRIYTEQVKAGVLSQEQLEKGLLGTSDAARQVAKGVTDIANKNVMRDLTSGFITQTASIRSETEALTMAAGPAAAYRYEQEKIAAELAKGVPLYSGTIAKIKEQALAIGSLTDRLDDLRTLKTTSVEVISGFAKDLRNELAGGAKFWDAFKSAGLNALNRISDKLIDMATNKLVENALGASSKSSGGLFGLLGGLLGFKGLSGSGAQPVNIVGGAGDMPVPTFSGASGGYTGNVGVRQIAGVVHGKEFVFDADKTAQFRPLFEAIHSGRLTGYASGGYVGPPMLAPSLSPASAAAAPIVKVYPAARGETFDARLGADGQLELVGRMMDEKLDTFSRRHLATRVHDIIADRGAR